MKEVDPIKLNFSMTNKCFDTTQICNYKRDIKINWNRAFIIGKLYVRLLALSSGVVDHILLFVYFFKLLSPDLASLDKILTSNFKALIFDRIETIMGKGENVDFHHFLLFL